MIQGAFGYGCYSEVLVAADSSEEALEILLKEATTEPDLYESYTRFPEDITITKWGTLSKGVISASGTDC
jgi:hypothetical protein